MFATCHAPLDLRPIASQLSHSYGFFFCLIAHCVHTIVAQHSNLFQISFPSGSCPRYECNDQLSPQPFRLPLPMRLQSTMIEPSTVGWLMNRADVRSELLQIPLRVGHL